jgi:hypothetical protein
MLNTTWEAGKGLVSASGTPLLLGGANSTNVVAGEEVAGFGGLLLQSVRTLPLRLPGGCKSWCVITICITFPGAPTCLPYGSCRGSGGGSTAGGAAGPH